VNVIVVFESVRLVRLEQVNVVDQSSSIERAPAEIANITPLNIRLRVTDIEVIERGIAFARRLILTTGALSRVRGVVCNDLRAHALTQIKSG
jgi:hypothetical protein